MRPEHTDKREQLQSHPKGWLRDSGPLPVAIKLGTRVAPRSLRALGKFVSGHDCTFGLIINMATRSMLYLARRLSRATPMRTYPRSGRYEKTRTRIRNST